MTPAEMKPAEAYEKAIKALNDARQDQVESREGIIPRPSHLELYVQLSSHTAPEYLGFCSLALMYHLVTTLMYCYQVIGFPIVMVTIDMMEMYSFITCKF